MKNRKPVQIEGEDVCVMMHTALRKCCDSAITTALYCLIHTIDVKLKQLDPWRMYGQLVADNINSKTGKVTDDVVIDAMLKAKNQLDSKWHSIKQSPVFQDCPASNERNLMFCIVRIMDCFNVSDWAGMSAYLQPED